MNNVESTSLRASTEFNELPSSLMGRASTWIRLVTHRGFVWPPIIAIATIAATPFLSPATQLKWILWLSFGIVALSLNLVWGRAGIFSFGQNALFGIGGYVYAITAVNLFSLTGETMSALALGAVAASIFAALLGYVMFYGRVGDVYLSIVTLAVTLVLYTVMSSTAGPQYHVGTAQLGGFNGMPSLPTIAMSLPRHGDGDTQFGLAGLFIFAVCLSAGLYMAVQLLATSRFGLVLAGIRENETRMELLGYDVRLSKLVAFVIGGAIAGLGGGLFAAWGTFINPSVFSLTQAAMVVIWVMVGGRSSLAGAFLGVAVVQWISDQAERIASEQTPLVLGVMLILVVLLFPRGLAPTLADIRLSAMRQVRRWLAQSRFRQTLPIAPESDQPKTATSSEHLVRSVRQPGRLVARRVSKNFGGASVLEGVTLEFTGSTSTLNPSRTNGESRVFALIGPNGAGKSTFFGTLTGQLLASAGEIELNGIDVTRLPAFKRARLGLGIKLQVPCVFQGLTVRENLALAIRDDDAHEAEKHADAILETVGLLRMRDQRASMLSHGQQQWLEIALVLAQNPSVILLDEPAAGMGPDERAKTLRLIRQLAAFHTTVVVEHDMAFVQALRGPVAMLHQGKVFRLGTFDELRNDPQVIDAYLGRHAHATQG